VSDLHTVGIKLRKKIRNLWKNFVTVNELEASVYGIWLVAKVEIWVSG
jgi:hypothetical protein